MEERSGTLRRALVAMTCAVALGCLLAPSALGAKKPKKVKDTTTWLCKPGIPDNPCEPGFDTTLISPSGQIVGTQSVKPDKKRKFDCFYVYPTVSDDKTPNSDLSIDPEERSIALYQAARYSLHCRVFAPMYRQLTLGAILSGASIPPDAQQIAYGDVAAAWKTYLRKYNQGRGVVLIGHSQGSFVLRELIHQLVDRNKNVRARLISAILLGGDVTVRTGGNVGGDFKNIPGCRKVKQAGCVMAFSTFDAPVPNDTKFGRPNTLNGPGLATTGDVLCTNPAALGGGSALLTSVFPTEPFAPGNHDRPRHRSRRRADALRGDHAVVPGPGLLRRLRRVQQCACAADQPRGRRAHPARGPGCNLGTAPGRRQHRARQPHRRCRPRGQVLAADERHVEEEAKEELGKPLQPSRE